jgi:hypothetical protein
MIGAGILLVVVGVTLGLVFSIESARQLQRDYDEANKLTTAYETLKASTANLKPGTDEFNTSLSKQSELVGEIVAKMHGYAGVFDDTGKLVGVDVQEVRSFSTVR